VNGEPIRLTVGDGRMAFPVTIDPDGTIRDEHGRPVGHATPEAMAALTDGAHLAVSITADVRPADPGLSL
jgi:hypothetical protein